MPRFVIDSMSEAAARYRADHAVVVVDVIRATTTAVTAVAVGWRCYPVPSLEVALPLAARLSNPLLAGELGGNMPYGFDMTNSPAEIARRTDFSRPMILLSTSGTQLIWEGRTAPALYVACLRNMTATVRHLAGRFPLVALIGAGSRGEFREEDQYCCAQIGAGLLERGYEPADDATLAAVERWRDQPPAAFLASNSVAYLERTGQLHDLDFIMSHVDDLDAAFVLQDGLVMMRSVAAERAAATHPLASSQPAALVTRWEGAP